MKKFTLISLMLITAFSISFAQKSQQNTQTHHRVQLHQTLLRNSNSLQKSNSPTITELTLPVVNHEINFNSNDAYIIEDEENYGKIVGYVFSITLTEPAMLNFTAANIPDNLIGNIWFDFYTSSTLEASSFLDCVDPTSEENEYAFGAGTHYLYFEAYYEEGVDVEPFDCTISISSTAITVANVTLDYSGEELSTDNANPVGEYYHWYYSFTLEESSVVKVEVEDENVEIYCEGLIGNYFKLKPGNHIVRFVGSNTSYTTNVSISIVADAIEDITLNYTSESSNINIGNIQANGEYYKILRFTIDEPSAFVLDEYSSYGYSIRADLTDENFVPIASSEENGKILSIRQAGTYFAIIYDGGFLQSSGDSWVAYDLNIDAKPLSRIPNSTLPYINQETWTYENLDTLADEVGRFIRFDMPQSETYDFVNLSFYSDENANLLYYAFSDRLPGIISDEPWLDTSFASNVVLFIPADSHIGEEAYLAAFMPTHVSELDYNQPLNINETSIFSNNEMHKFVEVDAAILPYAKDYAFTLTEDAVLKISLNLSNDFNGYGLVLIFDENFAGNNDGIVYNESFAFSRFNTNAELTTYSLPAGNYKMVAAFETENILPNFDIIANIKIEIVEDAYIDQPNEGAFVWEEITLPFNATLNFGEGFNRMTEELENNTIITKRGFKLILDEQTTISYELGQNRNSYIELPLFIYTDENMQTLAPCMGGYDYEYQQNNGLWEDNTFTLDAGTYYLVFINEEEVESYDVRLNNIPITNIISIDELLNDANIAVVDYSADLPFTESGFWAINASQIVESNNNFGYPGENFYAKAYKISNMQPNDIIKIHVSSDYDAIAYFYKNTESGFEVVEDDDDDWETTDDSFTNSDYDAYIEFTATEATDYYLVASDYAQPSNAIYRMAVTMWTDENQPEIEEPILATIISTTASQTEIHFDNTLANVTDNDRQLALLNLNLTATLTNNTTIEVANMLNNWTITPEQATCTFVTGYALDENYVPAVVTFTYEPVRYTISGTVRDAENNPMAGVTITLTETSSEANSEAVTATTSEDGTYSLTGIEAHSYSIAATKEGYTFAPETIAVAAMTADVNDQDFVGTAIPQEFTISGTVRDAENNPMAGVTITLTETSSTPTREAVTATTNEDGTYSLTGTEAHSYSIAATKEGYTFAPETIAVAAMTANLSDQDFVGTAIPQEFTISGTVRDTENNPMAGVEIYCLNTNQPTPDSRATILTAEDGTYSVIVEPNASYYVRAVKTGYDFQPQIVQVTNANVTEIDFVGTAIPQEFTISGTVRDAENNPMAGVTITLTETSSNPTREAVTATTSEDGTYSLTGIEAHSYSIAATKEGYTFAPETIAVAAMTANLSDQDFVGTAITQEFTISGTVRDAENNPMAGVEIIYFVEEEEAPESNSQILTAEDGTYSITVQANATYILRATKEGYSFVPEVLTVEVTNANVTDQDFVGQVVTSISEELSSVVSVYPNPATDLINIDGLSGNEQIQIFDAAGRLVISQTANSNLATINVSSLAQGSYLVKICKDSNVEVLKFIK